MRPSINYSLRVAPVRLTELERSTSAEEKKLALGVDAWYW